ncbi:hypothetical protein WIS52_14590 [Pseudonocardia nematodicida]|uniref:MmpS family membrane protein n=1 Tax=Pseudonocardia nematodicida TaxID=1206997 RepID=A0ABV1KCU1_9PSEU
MPGRARRHGSRGPETREQEVRTRPEPEQGDREHAVVPDELIPAEMVPADTEPAADERDDETVATRRRWPWVVGAAVLASAALAGGYLALAGGTEDPVATAEAPAEAQPAPVLPPGEPGTIRYVLEGPGAAAHVFYTSAAGSEQVTRLEMPWTVDVPFGEAPPEIYTLSASRGLDGTSGPLSCRILDAATGDVLAESSSDGDFASVQCRTEPAPAAPPAPAP